MAIERLSLSTHTLFQQLVEQAMADELSRNIGTLKGAFVPKEVKGRTYWYLQHGEAGKQKQTYLGTDSKVLQAAISRWRKERPLAESSARERSRLCAMLRQGGAAHIEAPAARILSLMANSGVFRLGTVLVGTYAFRSYANLLGVNWGPRAMQTQDFDLAGEPGLSMALALDSELEVDLPSVLEQAEMGFIPIPAFNPKHPSTCYRVRGSEVKVDVLAPHHGPPCKKPIFLAALNSHAHPLHYLSYLIEGPLTTVLINGDGIVVQVPQPARYAWHKLIISFRRPVTEQAKVQKDLVQAGALFEVLAEDRPGDLVLAWESLPGKGAKARPTALQGLGKLDDKALVGKIKQLIK